MIELLLPLILFVIIPTLLVLVQTIPFVKSPRWRRPLIWVFMLTALPLVTIITAFANARKAMEEDYQVGAWIRELKEQPKDKPIKEPS